MLFAKNNIRKQFIQLLVIVAEAVVFTVSGNGFAYARPDGNTAFWLAPADNTLFDNQVIRALGSHAQIVVVRGHKEGNRDFYDFGAIAERFHHFQPDLPVLSYAVLTRVTEGTRIDADIIKDIKPNYFFKDIQFGNTFLDIANKGYQAWIINRLDCIIKETKVDGLAFDLSIRTPLVQPKPLADFCRKNAFFCDSYSKAMDELFSLLRKNFSSKFLIYNGLFNFDQGSLDDQIKLLTNMNGAAIEYFGMNPRKKNHSFTEDILPYIKLMKKVPNDKKILFFGRGPWEYTNYDEDYEWQRYLYSSFLLVKESNYLFKYHNSFQVPAVDQGRSGGLDIYRDWSIDIGTPKGAYYGDRGLYIRDFTKGRVYVAPDDGFGGTIDVIGKMFTPEGISVVGQVKLKPGTGLILLSTDGGKTSYPIEITAEDILSWSLSDVKKVGDYVRVNAKTDRSDGEHDILLDYERSKLLHSRLTINARFVDASSKCLIVAEVDDEERRQNYVVISVTAGVSKEDVGSGDMVAFRTGKTFGKIWPYINTAVKNSDFQDLTIDGLTVFKNTPYKFRRWCYLRVVGSLDIKKLSVS